MKNDELINNIINNIEQKYASIKEPNWSFVNKALNNQPYREVIEKIKQYFQIKDITDSNDDVSFVYCLQKKNDDSANEWNLKLSMVGPYAVFVRCGITPEKNEVLTLELSSLLGKEERFLLEMLQAHKIEVLNQKILSLPIDMPMHIEEPGNVTLYHALFSDGYGLPWGKHTDRWVGDR